MLSHTTTERAETLRSAWPPSKVPSLEPTDPVSGLASRRSLEVALEREVGKAARDGGELTLILLDLDGFNALKERLGEVTAEGVLARLEAVIQLACNPADVAARYEGNVLAVLLTGCKRKESFLAAAWLRNLARDLDADVTLSAGISSYPAHAHSPQGVMKAAEEALLEAKKAGGNRATRSTRGALYRSNERRKALGKAPVPPKAQRKPALPQPHTPAYVPKPSVKLETAVVEVVEPENNQEQPVLPRKKRLKKPLWTPDIEAQLRQIAAARCAT